MEFHEKLKEIRRINSLTQEQLGSQLNVSRKTISSWENGRSYPDIQTLLKISNLINISLNDLLDEDQTLVNTYKKAQEIKQKDSIINNIFYYLNLLFFIIGFFNIVNPFKIDIIGVPPIGSVIVIIWCITYPNWKTKKKNNVVFYLLMIIFFLMEMNLRVGTDRDMVQNLNQLMHWNDDYWGMFTGISLKAIFSTISILIIVYGKNKKR